MTKLQFIRLTSIFTLALTACGGGSTGGGPDGSNNSDGSGSGDPAPGTAVIDATFSDAVAGYEGSTDAFTGSESGKTEVTTDGFTSFSAQTPYVGGKVRQISVTLYSTPATGMTYMFEHSPLGGPGAIAYQEVDGGNIKAWRCAGPLVFDSITSNVHTFHFNGTCQNQGTALVGVTIALTGIGTTP